MPCARNTTRRPPGQFRDFLCELARSFFQVEPLLIEHFRPLFREVIQHAWSLLAELAKLVIGTLFQAIERFDERTDFHLQRLI